MYEDDKIFGPLSFKQFVSLAGGSAIAFFINMTMPGSLGTLLLVIVFILTIHLAFFRFRSKKIDLDNWREYLAKYRKTTTTEKFRKQIIRGKANVTSQMHRRREKGLAEDPELNNMLMKLDSILTELGK